VVIKNEKMEFKKLNNRPDKFKNIWFLWPTDKDRLLLLIKDYIKNYGKKKKSAQTEGEQPAREYAELPNELKSMNGFSVKDLLLVVKILRRRGKLLKNIEWLENEGKNAKSEIVKVEAYNYALKKYLPILNTRETLSQIDMHTASEITESITPEVTIKSESKGKKSKEEQDNDILAAIEYVGITVDKDDLGTYSIVKNKNGNGIKYFVGKTEKAFSLSKKTCNKYINDFLNKPMESRKFITPSQVFADYIKEAETSLGIEGATAEELKDLFGDSVSAKDPSLYFKNIIKAYSRHSKAWQNFKKERTAEKEEEISMIIGAHDLMARRLVIGNTLSEILNENKILTSAQIKNADYKAGNISKDFGLDIDLHALGDEAKYLEKIEDVSFRTVSALHNTLQELRSYNQDITDEISLDYMMKNRIYRVLDEQRKEYEEKKKDYEKQIAKLSKNPDEEKAKEIKYYQKQLDKVQDKLKSEEFAKANTDYVSSKNNFRRVLSLSKYYDDLVGTDIKLKKEKAKLQKKPVPVEEILNSVRDMLATAIEPTMKIDKTKIVLNGTQSKKDIKKQFTVNEIDKEIDALCREVDADDEPVDYSDIRGELKKLKLYKDYVRKTKLESEIKAKEDALDKEVQSMGLTTEVLEKVNNNLTAVTAVNAATSSPLDNDLTRELIELLLEDKKRELERRNRRKNRVEYDYDEEDDYDDDYDEDDEEEVVTKKPKKKSKSKDKEEKTPEPDIFSKMVASELNDEELDIDSIDFGDEEDDEDDENDSENVVSNNAPANGFMQMPTMYDNSHEYESTESMGGVEPSIIPYLVAYQKDGVNVYGNYLEAFATYERYKYLIETKGNLLNTYVASKQSAGITPDDMVTDIKYRALKASLHRSNLDLADSVVANINLDKDLSVQLESHIDKSANQLVISDYKEITSSINFEFLKFLFEAKANQEIETALPTDVKDNLQTALTMLGSLAKIIMGDPQTTKNYDKYSSKMKQSYIDTLIIKLEAGELPLAALDSDSIYKRMLDYMSFSISAQNVLIQKDDAQDGGLISYPRNVYFGQKEQADLNLRAGYTLTAEQNSLITKRNSSLFDDLNNDVTNLFGTLYTFNGSHNKLLLRMKPGPLQGGVKFMENLVDILRLTYEPGEVKKVETKQEETAIAYNTSEWAPSDYEDEEWFLRKSFIVNKDKAKEYALQLAFGIKYGVDPTKAKLKEDFYENNMLNLQKINTMFKGVDEATISMITSVIRSIMTQTVDRYQDFVAKLDKQYLIFFNKMLYIVEEIGLIADFEQRSTDEKKYTIKRIEEDFIEKSEDNSEIHPELTSPRKMVNAYINLFRYYAATQLVTEYGSDERIVSKAFADEFEKIKREMRTFLIEKIKDSSRLNGYEIETAKYFELDIVVNDEERDNVRFADGSEETQDKKQKPLGTDIHNIDVIYAGIRQGFIQAIEQESDPLLREDMKDVADVLDIVGEISDSIEANTFEIKLPIGHTIKCNIRGLFQQYIFRYIMDKGAETDSFEFIFNELKNTALLGEAARDIRTAVEDLSGEELGVNLIMKFSTLSEDGTTLELGEAISTVMASVKHAKTAEEVYEKLNNDSFYKSAVDDIQKMFLDYFKRKKSEQIVF